MTMPEQTAERQVPEGRTRGRWSSGLHAWQDITGAGGLGLETDSRAGRQRKKKFADGQSVANYSNAA